MRREVEGHRFPQRACCRGPDHGSQARISEAKPLTTGTVSCITIVAMSGGGFLHPVKPAIKMNGRSMIAMAALVAGLGATWPETPEPPQVDVFINGVGGYPVYRIPSLICTPKGTLLAFCEGRSAGDQSPTDIVLRRSGDGGKTWQPMQVIVKAAPRRRHGSHRHRGSRYGRGGVGLRPLSATAQGPECGSREAW